MGIRGYSRRLSRPWSLHLRVYYNQGISTRNYVLKSDMFNVVEQDASEVVLYHRAPTLSQAKMYRQVWTKYVPGKIVKSVRSSTGFLVPIFQTLERWWTDQSMDIDSRTWKEGPRQLLTTRSRQNAPHLARLRPSKYLPTLNHKKTLVVVAVVAATHPFEIVAKHRYVRDFIPYSILTFTIFATMRGNVVVN